MRSAGGCILHAVGFEESLDFSFCVFFLEALSFVVEFFAFA